MKVIRGGKHRNAKATNFKVEFRQIDNIWWVSSLKEKKVINRAYLVLAVSVTSRGTTCHLD